MLIRANDRTNLSQLTEHSLLVLPVWLSRLWSSYVESPTLNVVYAPTLDAARQVNLKDGKAGDQPSRDRLPWMSLVAAEFSERQGPFGSQAGRLVGIHSGFAGSGGGVKAVAERVVPIDIGVVARFVSQNAEEARAMAYLLLWSAPNVAVDIRSSQTGAIYRIVISVDPRASVAQPDMNSANAVSTLDTTFIIKTYAGLSELQNVVRTVNLGISDSGKARTASEISDSVEDGTLPEDGGPMKLWSLKFNGPNHIEVTT